MGKKGDNTFKSTYIAKILPQEQADTHRSEWDTVVFSHT